MTNLFAFYHYKDHKNSTLLIQESFLSKKQLKDTYSGNEIVWDIILTEQEMKNLLNTTQDELYRQYLLTEKRFTKQAQKEHSFKRDIMCNYYYDSRTDTIEC